MDGEKVARSDVTDLDGGRRGVWWWLLFLWGILCPKYHQSSANRHSIPILLTGIDVEESRDIEYEGSSSTSCRLVCVDLGGADDPDRVRLAKGASSPNLSSVMSIWFISKVRGVCSEGDNRPIAERTYMHQDKRPWLRSRSSTKHRA